MHPAHPVKVLAKIRAKGEFWFNKSIVASLGCGSEARYVAIACDGSGFKLANSMEEAVAAARLQFPYKDVWVRPIRLVPDRSEEAGAVRDITVKVESGEDQRAVVGAPVPVSGVASGRT